MSKRAKNDRKWIFILLWKVLCKYIQQNYYYYSYYKVYVIIGARGGALG
jgi:hypothetical protein